MLVCFCLQMLLAALLYCQTFHSLGTALCHLLADNLSLDWHLMYLSLNVASVYHYKMPWLQTSWWCFWLSHVCLGMCCSRSSHISTVSPFHSGSHTSALKAKIFLASSSYLKMILITLCYGEGTFLLCMQPLWVWLYPFSGYHFKNTWYLHASEITFIFIQFYDSWWLFYITGPKVLLWSIPWASYLTIRMSLAMPNTFDKSLKILLIFCLNISPAGTTPIDSFVNLYLTN